MKDPSRMTPYVQRSNHKNLVPVVEMDVKNIEETTAKPAVKKRKFKRQDSSKTEITVKKQESSMTVTPFES